MMSTILFAVILVVTCNIASASKKDINALLLYSQQNTNTCQSPGLQCKDCETIQYCSSSNLESLFSIRCEDQSRLRPYCDFETNTCVKDKPIVCTVPEQKFHCPGTGYYPDLEDCANYHICDENKVGTKLSCPAGSNWVQGNFTCTAGLYCRSYSPKLGQCKGKTNKLVAYSPDKNLYVLCLTNGPILFQCPNKWEVFDEAEVSCKFECTQNGFFPNPSDPKKFYSCTKVGKGYESVIFECPDNYEFVELEAGQGICTFRTTTTTTTEVPTTGPTTTEFIECDTQAEEITQNEENAGEPKDENLEHNEEITRLGDQNEEQTNSINENVEQAEDQNEEQADGQNEEQAEDQNEEQAEDQNEEQAVSNPENEEQQSAGNSEEKPNHDETDEQHEKAEEEHENEENVKISIESESNDNK